MPLFLKNILADTPEGIHVTIYYEVDGDVKRAELVFPPYLVEYEENTPARILEKHAYGSGERYRHCIYSGLLDFEQYDQLFDFSVAVDHIEYPIQCAVGRLRYPYSLKEEYETKYEDFLRKEMDKVLSFYIKKEDGETVKWMLDTKRLNKEDMNLASDLCRKQDSQQRGYESCF